MRRLRLAVLAVAIAAAAPLAAVGALKHAVATAPGGLPAPEASALVVDREGVLLRPFPVADGRWRLATTIADVDPDYLAMLLAFEDRRFRDHRGVDPLALVRSAVASLVHARAVSGGSTLTMQVARLIDGRATRAPTAKLGQIVHALALEAHNDKAAILTQYLNRAPFGGNLEGVRTAALAYFGKEPKRLSAAEAALLVALPQSPESRRLDAGETARRAAKTARDRVLARARATGLIDERQYARAVAEPLPAGRRAMPALAAHLAERAAAATPDRPVHRVTVDAALQGRLETLARARADRLGGGVSVAILVADHTTGEIRASVGSADYFDTARDGYVDMTRAVRSPGSTLKPLIYGLGFQYGIIHPESLIDDRPTDFGGYRPGNFDGAYRGTVTVRQALQMSLNIPAVEVLQKVGPARLLAALKRAGAAPVLADRATANLAIGLGGIGMRLTDLVAVQAMIAAGGRPVALHSDPDAGSRAPARPVLDPRAAWQVASVLAGVKDPHGMTPDDIAFKTGTTYGYRDAWAVGFDGRHVVGVWVGRPDGKPLEGFGERFVGIEIAAPIFEAVFAAIGERHRLPAPPPGTLIASTASLPPAMRHFGRDVAVRNDEEGPRIAFPPDDAQLEMTAGAPLTVEVERGELPLAVLVNGAPLATDPWQRAFDIVPEGAGQVEIVVIDAEGAAARSSVFLR